jgi:hypothetical protein
VTGQDFDCDYAIQASVTAAIDLSHTAGANGGLNFVRSELTPRNEWHELGGLYLGPSSLLLLPCAGQTGADRVDSRITLVNC